MSIIIQFNSSTFKRSSVTVTSNNQCHSKKDVNLEMVPGIEHSNVSGMTDDENSIDVASSSAFSTTLKEVKINNHSGSYFGLPYQDHNYGAPPPPTPPSHSPCPSPKQSFPLPDEDSTLSVISNSTNEEPPEESVTRCICGFEHDDEYMICCDNCLVWQHTDCMGIDRNNIPDTYLCDECEPRKLDRHKAKILQSRKKGSLTAVKPSQPVLPKQEPNFNNRLFGKDFKKKSLANDSEEWTLIQKNEIRDNYNSVQHCNYSTDSDDGLNKTSERRPKTRSKRRKREDDKNSETLEHSSKRKSKKHGKERMEAKRSKLRRGKNKESTSTADEEAQDAWEYSLEWCEKNFEDAINNQYTPEIQHIARTLNTQGFEKKYLEQMRTKQCHAYDDGKRKQLVCLRDLPRNSPLIEYKGKFLLASQFHDLHPLYNKRLYPYVLFYVLDHEEICVDASMYGNDARFVRRSCKPNAEIRHMVYNGKLHLYLTSTRVIFREDEVTIPLKIHPNDRLKDFECACNTEECLVKPKKKSGTIEIYPEKRRRTRRSTMTADEESNHSVDVKPTWNSVKVNVPVEKPKQVIIKTEPIEPEIIPPENSPVLVKDEPEFNKSASDHEPEEPSSSKKQKTREERKIEKIVQMIGRLEQAAKRKQLALEKKKSLHPKVKTSEVKLEPKPETEEKPLQAEIETLPKDEEKVAPSTPKSKKGKRRRSSGTPSRKRTRTNSGGSDLMSLEEFSPTKVAPTSDVNSSSSIDNVIPVPVSSPLPSSTSGLLSPVTTVTPVPPHVLKTKRSLMNEWLQEKSECIANIPASSSANVMPIHTEMKWNMSSSKATCYVRCTKDTPHPSGISAAHLRRSNSAGHMKPNTDQGSAKKRWLRQAMASDVQMKIDTLNPDHQSNLENGCLSPTCHSDIDNLGILAEDVPTPLKKRRLMRESIESLPSPPSPSTATSIDDTDATTVSNSLISDSSTEHGSDAVDSESCVDKDHLSLTCLEGSKISLHKAELSESSEDKKNTVVLQDLMACSEAFFTPTSSLELASDTNLSEVEESSSKTEYLLQQDDNKSGMFGEFSHSSTNNSTDCFKDIDLTNVKMTFDTKLSEDCVDLEISRKTFSEENTSNCVEINVTDEISENKNCSDTDKVTLPSDTDSFAQAQSQNVSAGTIAPSFVNIDAPIQVDNSSKTESFDINLQSLVKDNNSKSVLSNSSMQNDKDIFSIKNHKNMLSTEDDLKISDNVSENEKYVNNTTDDSTNNAFASPYTETELSPTSPCNNLSDKSFYFKKIDNIELTEAFEFSNKKVNDAFEDKDVEGEVMEVEDSLSAEISLGKVEDSLKPISLSQCESIEDSSLNKNNCASATQKRKVSLSEYRQRMRENTTKPRNSEKAIKNQTMQSVCAISLPDTLSEQVTLAPLPLFEKMRGEKKISKPTHLLVNKVKKENLKADLENEITEHRENLNERLKREFGFDVSDSARSSPPPPPPPPRHIRPAQKEPVTVVMPPSQFNFRPSPFPQVRPQFMVPRVPNASPYMPTQAPVLPSLHPVNANPAQCSIQPPLLPSTHPFTPSITLIRQPQHDYSPVNAQRFAALVQQPPPPPSQKTYLPVYQSGVYK